MAENDAREWHDERAHHLYAIVTTSNDRTLRRQARRFLGALERAGSSDAAWAMEKIRKLT